MSNIVNTLEFFVYSCGAESGPPLGTVLGNLGLNTAKFCKEFNDFTKDLPAYFNVKVRIFVYDNRSFSFIIFRPTSSFILSLIKLERLLPSRVKIGIKTLAFEGVTFLQLLKLSLFIFPNNNVENLFKVCWSTLTSLNIYLFIV